MQNASEVLTDPYKVAEKFCAQRGTGIEIVKQDVLAARVYSDPRFHIGVGGCGGCSSGFEGWNRLFDSCL